MNLITITPQLQTLIKSRMFRQPFNLFAMATLIFSLTGCKWEVARNPQASLSSCEFLWDTFKDSMNSAKYSEGIDKVYYSEMGQMNLSTLLSRGCCKYENTCPAAITE